jgi:starvation-inducible DNA-binding protein
LADTEVVKLGAAEMVGVLLADHEALIRTLRAGARAADEKFDDAGTNDFLVGLMASHEKNAWMLRASAA